MLNSYTIGPVKKTTQLLDNPINQAETCHVSPRCDPGELGKSSFYEVIDGKFDESAALPQARSRRGGRNRCWPELRSEPERRCSRPEEGREAPGRPVDGRRPQPHGY